MGSSVSARADDLSSRINKGGNISDITDLSLCRIVSASAHRHRLNVKANKLNESFHKKKTF